jgi:hypothetical protein
MTIRSVTTALLGAAVLALTSPVMAQTMSFKATLSGAEEVPPLQGAAKGELTATFDQASKRLAWKGSYSGLSGPATAAHFHSAEKGKNGSVAVPIAPATSPMEGSATLNDQQAADLMAGKWYVNIHTEAHKAGEIRGQMTR